MVSEEHNSTENHINKLISFWIDIDDCSEIEKYKKAFYPFFLPVLIFMVFLSFPPSAISGRIVFFDFDGTLAKGDSGWLFLLFSMRLRDLPRFILNFSFAGIGFFLGKLEKDVFKERCFGAVFKGRSLREINSLGKSFSCSCLGKGRLFDGMMRRFFRHRKKGDRCILVSASLSEYLKFWAEEKGFETVLATRLQADGAERATGRFMDGNCCRSRKLSRILAYLKTPEIPLGSVAYGNSEGDFEMLEAVLKAKGQSWYVLSDGTVRPWTGAEAGKK